MAVEESEDKERGFKVQDRRRFSPEGEARPGAADSAEPAAAETANAGAAPESHRPPPGGDAAALPEPAFAALIWSLSEQALAALGEMPDPASGTVKRDLAMARQMIDIIRMLRDKTKGNLDHDEETLVAEILSTLQIKYVELARPPAR